MEPRQHSLWLRNALGTMTQGFLFGAGFSTAVIASVIFSMRSNVFDSNGSSGSSSVATGDATKDVVLDDIEELPNEGFTAIVGSARNVGKAIVHSTHMRVEMFRHGKFVDLCTGYISDDLSPGRSQHFKFDCGSKNVPTQPHDSFKLSIVR